MRIKKIMSLFLLIVIGIAVIWYINFPAHEKLAEERIDTYMAAQGIDKTKVSQKNSFMNGQGRWEIHYKFEDEENIEYHYNYDKTSDRAKVFIRNRGLPIQGGMKHPSLDKNQSWTKFDENGNIILN